MPIRVVKRYNECFKKEVVEELEIGRSGARTPAQLCRGIAGTMTFRKCMGKYGRNRLMAKVVHVEKSDEQDLIRKYQKRIAHLEKALCQKQAENLLNATFLKLACERLGQEEESFKKKADEKRSTAPESSNGAG